MPPSGRGDRQDAARIDEQQASPHDQGDRPARRRPTGERPGGPAPERGDRIPDATRGGDGPRPEHQQPGGEGERPDRPPQRADEHVPRALHERARDRGLLRGAHQRPYHDQQDGQRRRHDEEGDGHPARGATPIGRRPDRQREARQRRQRRDDGGHVEEARQPDRVLGEALAADAGQRDRHRLGRGRRGRGGIGRGRGRRFSELPEDGHDDRPEVGQAEDQLTGIRGRERRVQLGGGDPDRPGRPACWPAARGRRSRRAGPRPRDRGEPAAPVRSAPRASASFTAGRCTMSTTAALKRSLSSRRRLAYPAIVATNSSTPPSTRATWPSRRPTGRHRGARRADGVSVEVTGGILPSGAAPSHAAPPVPWRPSGRPRATRPAAGAVRFGR